MSNSIFDEEIQEVIAVNPESGPEKDQHSEPVALKLAFVGVGAAGGRIVNEFYERGYRRCLAINTCLQDRAGLNEDLEFVNLNIGGSGKNPAVSKDLMSKPQNKVQFMNYFKEILGTEFDFVMVCAGLGGGTGSGGGPELVKALKEYIEINAINAKVGAILSLPQNAEGSRVAANALGAYEAFARLNPAPLLIIDNARVARIRKSTVGSLHKDANKDVVTMLHTLNVLSATPAIQSFDKADFSQLLSSGMVTLGMSGIPNWQEGSDVLSKAIMATYQSATLSDADISHASQAACIILAGTNVLNAFSNEELMNGLEMLRNSSKHASMMLHPGIYENTSARGVDSLRVFVGLGGIKPNMQTLNGLAKIGNVDIPELAKFFGFK